MDSQIYDLISRKIKTKDMSTKLPKFSDRLKYLMEKEGIGKLQLDRKAGLYNGQTGMFLRGKAEPNLKTIQKLVKFFKGVSVKWLVMGTGKP